MKRSTMTVLTLVAMLASLCLWVGCQNYSVYEATAPHQETWDLRAQTYKSLETSGAELWILEKQAGPSSKVKPGDDHPRGGELRAKTEKAARLIPLPLKHTDVKAQVTMYLGAVQVKQQYHNPYSEKIEAVYVFPLPENAAVREFVMTIGDRHIRGIIREREEARKIYETAKRQGYVASLLTQERPNIFTQSVANIEPGKQIDIDITYFHTLRYSEGEYEFTFPMVVGPRFNPEGFTAGVGAVGRGDRGASGQQAEVEYLRPDEISSHDISMEVRIDAGVSMEKIESPSHQVDINRLNSSQAVVTLSPGDKIPNKDFVLRYKVTGKPIKAGLAAHRDESGGYFTLVLQPPDSLSGIPSTPREMIFVVDCSGSMDGAPLAAAKRVVEKCLKRLSPNDTFQIIRFDDSATPMASRPLPATPENVGKGLDYVDNLSSGGGTMMIHGIRAALGVPHDEERYRIVAFLTDGYVGNDRELIGEVKKRIGASRLFSFCIGSSPNRYLTSGFARAGRGAESWVGLNDESQKITDQFFQRIEHPALTDIRIDWGGMKVTDVYPSPLPDLFVGMPVILTGRFEGKGETTVKIHGKIGGKPHVAALTVNMDDPGLRHKALGSLWARAKITELYDQMTYVRDASEVMHEIKAVALRYSLMSDFTAFVAVDSANRTAGDHGYTIKVPVPVPDGVKYENTVQEKPGAGSQKSGDGKKDE